MPAYTTAFDLVARPDLIQPPYGFYAIFGLAAVVLAAIGLLLFAYRRRIGVLLFAGFWTCTVSYILVTDVQRIGDVRARVHAGQYTVVDGCLERFHPGSPGIEKGGDERWSVAGHAFSYANGSVGPRYHMTEAAGGAVHADTRVRVTHLPEGDEILRLEVIPHACAPAPDAPA